MRAPRRLPWRLFPSSALCLLLVAGLALAEAPARRVLIAVETSNFKTAVATRVAEALRHDGYAVTTIKLDRLTTDDVPAYQAIVVINTCRAWRPSSALRKFLKGLDDTSRKKVVVLTTADSEECALRTTGIDAISSASRESKIDGVTQTLLEKVRTRLAPP